MAIQDTKVWKMEHEFYEFVKAQFESLKSELEETAPKSKKNLFNYEKIRPRNPPPKA